MSATAFVVFIPREHQDRHYGENQLQSAFTLIFTDEAWWLSVTWRQCIVLVIYCASKLY